jgi:hypothetical protein
MSCHGGLVAHNIEYDMVSPWETMGFLSI